MMHEVYFLPSAARDVTRLPADQRDRLRDAIEALALWPAHGRDVRKLQGMEEAQYRLRVGDFRVLFDVDAVSRRVAVVRVRRRDRAYG
jgi:mRNA interferase RelE/StbE